MTKLDELASFGQSVWLDNINRTLFKTGALKDLIAQGLLGMTSNPTIFDNAISKTDDYDEEIGELAGQNKSTFEIYDELTIRDIQKAADLFLPVYRKTEKRDGYVSLEINPTLARKSAETIEEGKRLYRKVNRPNLMLKVPATDEGFSPVEEFLASGMNVNVTLIFSPDQYQRTARAYIRGMQRLVEAKGDPHDVHSVASVFVSRIDSAIDTALAAQLADEGRKFLHGTLQSLPGKAAVANSRIIYRSHGAIFAEEEFKILHQQGVSHQRVLWASTSSKNPAYSDVKYVEELIAKNTVNTMPDGTLKAFMDHGVVKDGETGENPEEVVAALSAVGISVANVNAKLLADGVASFQKSFESLMKSIEAKAVKHRR